ncbi:AAA family ATPase [Tessaracoccus sp.]
MPQYEDNCQAVALIVLTRVPLILWGDPGQGKSTFIESMGKAYNMHTECIFASNSEPSDFAGMPVVNPATGEVHLSAAPWARRLVAAAAVPDGAEGKTNGGIAFYDEVNTAPPAVQATLLRPILTNWVGDLKLPEGTITIAAANPTAVAADGWDLAAPLANRFAHLQWALTVDVVRNGFAGNWPVPTFPAFDEADYVAALSEVMINIGAFVSKMPHLLTAMPSPQQNAADTGYAFPTPRSWEMAGKVYAMAKATGSSDAVTALVVNGCIGSGPGTEFLTYLRDLDLPDPEVLLTNPESWVFPAARGDKVYATMAGTVSALGRNLTPDRWHAYGRMLAVACIKNHSDVAFPFAKQWYEMRTQIRGTAMEPNTAKAIAPLLSAMGKATV